MQAPLSHTASGEHFSRLSSPPATIVARLLSDAPRISVPVPVPVPVDRRNTKVRGLDDVRAPEPGMVPEVADGIGLAHDAGNLLGAIRLYCDLLALPGVLRSEHRHYADELRRLTARSGSLIDRLLRPGAPLAGSGVAGCVAERIRPAEVVMECRGVLDALAGPGSLMIAMDADARDEVAMPREALERILVNLTKNAAEAGRTGGTEVTEEGRGIICVRVCSVADWGAKRVRGVAVSVEDHGRGMEEHTVRAVLSGQRSDAHDQAPHRPGRGIGLCVVRELVGRTGGELRIESRLGQGTLVEVVWAVLAKEEAGSG